MERKDKIINIVFQAVDKINDQLPQEEKIAKSLETPLIGPSSTLDSLGIINLIVAVEEGIYETFEVALTLANENAFSSTDSPFKNVHSLVEYIDANLKVQVHG